MTEQTPRPSRAIAAVWLVYLAFIFIEPWTAHEPLWRWLVTIASVLLFLPLYFGAFGAFANPERGERARKCALAMSVLGVAMIPVNIGGATYAIFGVSILGHVLTNRRRALLLIGAVTVAVLVVTLLTRHPFEYWQLIQPAMIVTVGGGNLLMAEERRRAMAVRQAREEVAEIGKVAERERIARDLHDLLGHTLSVIALKAELAAKIADTDPERAVREIREVEQVSREALTEVRQAVEGYRSRGFSGELANARRALDAAGVALDADAGSVDLAPRQESILALALREAITNIVRHARATRCRVRLGADDGQVTLRVEDDGVGGRLVEGNGLNGMRERVAAVGGTVAIDGHGGVHLTITMPRLAAGEGAS